MMISKPRLSLFCVVAVLISSAAANAQLLAPKVVSTSTLLSVTALRPGDSFDVAVKAIVKPGYHVAANDKAALYPAKLKLSAPRGISFGTPQYAKPQWVKFSFMPDKIPVYQGEFVVRVRGDVAKDMRLGDITISSTLDSQACKDDQCFPPQLAKSSVRVRVIAAGARVAPANQGLFKRAAAAASEDQGVADRLANAGILQRFLLLYAGGLLLSLTPCVYPMIPVTIGYFANESGKRKRRVALLAGAYVFGLAASYSAVGAIAATTGGMIGSIMQQPAAIIGVAVVLVALALSMFGLYELQAPTFIQSKSSGRDGVLGALLMGLIFGIVAAPCVGPFVLGLTLYVAKVGSPVLGFLMFFALALGLGTPLFLLATFSGRLPVPGVWMVTVKKAAGFLLLGTAAYFLQPIVPESVGRLLIPAVVLAAGIYLGLMESSLKSNRKLALAGKTFSVVALVAAVALALPGSAPRDRMVFKPYTPQAYESAVDAGKPVIIDFSARWCAACRELEKGPFSDHRVAHAAADFVKLRMDGTTHSAAVAAAEKRFGVSGRGYPAVIFIDRSGKEVRAARVTGYVDSSEMIRRIEMVH